MAASPPRPTARLTEALAPEVAAAGYDLEDLSVSAAGRRSVVRVLVDKDGGVTLDDVADVSRLLGEALDRLDEAEPGLLGAQYVLEVSSPGVDRPLTAPRHWRRNVGRLVAVTRHDGEPVTGRVRAADDDAVTLEVAGAEQVVPYCAIARGVVQVEFGRKGAGDDLDDITGDDSTGDDTTGDTTGDETTGDEGPGVEETA
jgi:ribosome maturation factor RimP